MTDDTPKTEWHPQVLRFLQHMVTMDASDLYVTANAPPTFRQDGACLRGKAVLAASKVEEMANSLMNEEQRAEFATAMEMNLAVSLAPQGRFRVNILRQRGQTAMVIRMIRSQIRSLDELRHPPVLKELMGHRRGLILVVGGTGSGKSTTLAAMIDHRNATETGHIVTIEDPVEFVHWHKQCVVTQREVGADTTSYAAALKNTLRQAPDVILIGEIRDAHTMEAALTFAETGHLCLSTLHANSADQAIERILSFFPSERHEEVLLQLSMNLRGIVSQRLVVASDGGRAAVLDILLNTPRIKDLIRAGDVDFLKEAMAQGHPEGCRTFDASLLELVMAERVTEADALRASDSPNNLRLQIQRARQKQPEPLKLRLLKSGMA